MYLPNIYKQFLEKYPRVFEGYKQLGAACREAGPLDPKTQDLIKLGIAIGANSRGAIMSHTRKALSSGASLEEIHHTVLMALTTTGFPNMMAAMAWVNDVLEEAVKEK